MKLKFSKIENYIETRSYHKRTNNSTKPLKENTNKKIEKNNQ